VCKFEIEWKGKGPDMARKILSGTLIALSAIFLVASLVGIGSIWYYRKPVTDETLSRLEDVDAELALAQVALSDAQSEMKRALRFVDRAEKALETFSEQSAVAKEFLDTVNNVLDETITPSLETSRDKLDEAQQTMEDLRASIELLNQIPFISLDIPDDGILNSFAEILDSLEGEVLRVEKIADEASTFMNDTSYLMGGDLSETRDNILDMQAVITDYEGKIDTWRRQIMTLKVELPGWINRAAAILTIFLLWFAFSQFGLFLHGLNSWHGGDALAALRKNSEDELNSGEK
jgi:type VI protein secretion system component VasK